MVKMMNILIVDDDIPTTQAISTSLDKMPLQLQFVYVAYNVVAAKSLIKQHEIDIVICDIEMPKYSGIQLIEWVREQGYDIEFIFLTCHADFGYATKALQFKADAYITKPLDFAVLQNALTQVVEKILYRRELKRRSELGELWLDNRTRVENALWRELLFSDAMVTLQNSRTYEEHRKANINLEGIYRLVLCSVMEAQITEQHWDITTFRYAAGNIASDILFGAPNNPRVFDYSHNGRIYITAAVDDKSEHILTRCESLSKAYQSYLQCGAIVYVGPECAINELSSQRRIWEQTDENNVARSIAVVTLTEQVAVLGTPDALDVERVQELLGQGNAIEAVNQLRKTLEKANDKGLLSAQTLHSAHQDYMQVVFSCLYKENILAHELFLEEGAKQLERTCENSLFDLLKWASFATQKTVETIAQARKSETIVEKIKRFVEENSGSELSREDIARHVYLSPDYVAKLFKAETGYFLKDYVNERKIHKAKQLLTEGEMNISEIAGAVGFDNFSYFSTLFKKSTGLSPSQYKKQL